MERSPAGFAAGDAAALPDCTLPAIAAGSGAAKLVPTLLATVTAMTNKVVRFFNSILQDISIGQCACARRAGRVRTSVWGWNSIQRVAVNLRANCTRRL